MALNKAKLGRRAATAVPSILVIAVIVVWAPTWALHLLLAAIGLIGTLEFDSIARGFGYKIYREPVMLFILLGIGSIYIPWFDLKMLPYVAFALVCLVSLTSDDFTKSLPILGISIMATGYLALTVVALAYTSLLKDSTGNDVGRILVAFCVLMVWAGDTFAYFAGNFFGKHKIAPKASPNKTWEGTIGNLIGNFLLAWGAKYTVLPQLNYVDLIVLTLVFGLLGFWGDLIESTWKRGAHLKDSGTLLPGHGGFLDRTDSIFLTAPLFYYYMKMVVLVRPI
ncbi:MAG: phosphatidate cytidylyltransferase [Acidobacteriota bacterium]|nr:phosphatidate cytidylyltransferase [Acidobacteriota bacterium]